MLETAGYLLALFILFNGDVTFNKAPGATPQMMQANEDIRYQLSGKEKQFVKKLYIPEKDERIYNHAIMLYSNSLHQHKMMYFFTNESFAHTDIRDLLFKDLGDAVLKIDFEVPGVNIHSGGIKLDSMENWLKSNYENRAELLEVLKTGKGKLDKGVTEKEIMDALANMNEWLDTMTFRQVPIIPTVAYNCQSAIDQIASDLDITVHEHHRGRDLMYGILFPGRWHLMASKYFSEACKVTRKWFKKPEGEFESYQNSTTSTPVTSNPSLSEEMKEKIRKFYESYANLQSLNDSTRHSQSDQSNNGPILLQPKIKETEQQKIQSRRFL